MKKIKLTLDCLLTVVALSCTSAFSTVFAEEELPDGIVSELPPLKMLLSHTVTTLQYNHTPIVLEELWLLLQMIFKAIIFTK